ncbi:MAG TPA: Na+/H+ antiporter subunit C [Candidatus Omnitrophota bacterium]|nr:Na+/H+ antiporter subunit C [Candidatus Omnitrophota bacterium]
MELMFALTVGLLYAAGFFLVMRHSLMKLVLGLIFLSHGANLLIFSAGGLESRGLPIIAEGSKIPQYPMPDPLPQALILTAIVISFGILAFALVLVYRSFRLTGSDDSDQLDSTEK